MNQPPELFTVSQVDGVPELILGTADFVTRPIIVMAQDQLIAYIDKHQPQRLIINFKNVHRISSEFITSMIRVRDHVKVNDGEMKFSHVNESVYTPFKITNLAGRVFPIYETSAEAVDSF